MNLRKKYLKFPVEICRYILENRISTTAQVYTYLNFSCSGKIIIDRHLRIKISGDLSLHPKTINHHILELKKRNWVGYNPNSGISHIRGMDKIRQIEGFHSRTAAEFSKDDIRLFKSFCTATFVAYLINIQRSKRWRSERYQSRSNHKHHQKISEYDSVSLNFLADSLKIT